MDLKKGHYVVIDGVQSIQEMALNGVKSMEDTVQQKNKYKWNINRFINKTKIIQNQAYI